MKYYFKLQLLRIQRWMENAGINPFVGLILGIIAFFILSKFIFYKTEYAHWIYLAIAVSIILKLSEQNRNDVLKSVYTRNDYLLLRLFENFIIALPFQTYLLLEGEFVVALILLPIIVIMTFFRMRQFLYRTIPTPFSKFPFEFIVGFRRTFWIIAIAYFLVFKAIQVGNFNLGLFGLMLNYLISMSYYHKPEPEFYVWIHSYSTNGFLSFKIVTSIICISFLCFLPFLAMLIAFSADWLTTVILWLAGYIILGVTIVAKYSSFPNEMSIPQGILLGLSVVFPPMIIFTIWMFYSKSKKRLEPILEW